MKQEITEKQEAYICVCFLLKKLGYKEGSRASVVVFDDNYIYDEDPDHPESHKKGEMRFYDHYYKNSDEDTNRCEMPTLEEINMWLLKQKGYYVGININDGKHFDYTVYEKQKGCTISLFEWVGIIHGISESLNPEESYIKGFRSILTKLKTSK